jgi:hypothetical protein
MIPHEIDEIVLLLLPRLLKQLAKLNEKNSNEIAWKPSVKMLH